MQYNDDEAEAIEPGGRKVAELGAHYLGRVDADVDKPAERVLVYLDADGEKSALVNPRTGERRPDNSRPPGKLMNVAFDDQGALRAATTIDTTFWTERTHDLRPARPTAGAEWQLLQESKDHPRPLAAAVRAQGARHHRRAIARRPGTPGPSCATTRASIPKSQLMAGHPREDIVFASGYGNEVFQRVVTGGLKSQTHWFDERWAVVQATLDKALPGRSNTVLSGDPQHRVLVMSSSDVDPGRWYVFDVPGRTLKEVAQSLPRLGIEEDACDADVALRGTRRPEHPGLPDAAGGRGALPPDRAHPRRAGCARPMGMGLGGSTAGATRLRGLPAAVSRLDRIRRHIRAGRPRAMGPGHAG